jgi:hypothetical protein
MLSADHRAARALMEARLGEVQDQERVSEVGQGPRTAPGRQAGPGWQLLSRLAMLLVALGGRLVRYGLPPYSPVAAGPVRRS